MTAAPVIDAGTIGSYAVLSFHAPNVVADAAPGRFVNIATEALLRRPFSIYRADRTTGEVAIAFARIGAGTDWLATRARGDVLDVVGPLGVGFDPHPGPALLVGGGYGTAALCYLAERLDGPVHAIVGARSADRLFIDDTLRARCETITVVTDDGSAGERGIVTDPLPALIDSAAIGTVYACGPNPMLAAVADASSVPTQVATEEFMACGIGVCWTCVVPIRDGDAVAHKRCCTDGPVFAGEALAWA